MPRPRCARVAALTALAALHACGVEPSTPPVDAATTHFTVRGRWPAPARVTWRAERDRAPIAEAAWQDAVARACAAWNATGCVELVPAADGEDADVTLGWRRGHHGACEPFGIAKTVAHSGPVATGTFVHFDADREWVPDAPDDAHGYSVYGTALHELGHVLGLGHSAAEDAVMRTGEVGSLPISASDLYGLQSLYGGGRDAPGDVRVLRGDGAVAHTLRGVAPDARAEVACFDVDGDGRCEVVIWRTDRAGNGALMSYHFDERGLIRTTGPYYGIASPADGARNGVAVVDGQRLFVTAFKNGRVVARRFDEHGLLTPHQATDLSPPPAPPQRGDVDGDGVDEALARVGAR